MYAEQDQLDEQLAHLAELLRRGDMAVSSIQFAEFSAKLDRVMRHEERALAFVYERANPTTPNPIAKVKQEHTSLRSLLGLLADALGRTDDRRGLEVIARLRSVLVVHVAKEQWLQPIVQTSA